MRAIDAREVSWRIQPVRAVSGQLTFLVDGQPVAKTIEAGTRPALRSGTQRELRARDAVDARRDDDSFRHGGVDRDPLSGGQPADSGSTSGTGWSGFSLVSMVAALLLKKRFGVVI